MPHAPLLKCKTTGRSRSHHHGNCSNTMTLQGHNTGSLQTLCYSNGGTLSYSQHSPQNLDTFSRCSPSPMGKKSKPVSNGTHRNGDRPKIPGASRTKHKSQTFPLSLQIIAIAVVIAAVAVFLVTQTDVLVYFTSQTQSVGNTPSRTESKSSTSSSSSSASQKSSSESAPSQKQTPDKSSEKEPSKSKSSSQKQSSNKSSEKAPSKSKSSPQKQSQDKESKSKHSNNGGWRLPSAETVKKYDSSVCTIDRKSVQDITKEEFEKVYRYKKPLIVTFPNGAKDWTQPEKWSIKSLKREYGEWSIMSGNSLEIVRRGGNGYVQTSFSEFVDGLMKDKDDTGSPSYVFDRSFYNDSSLPRTLRPPKYFEIKDGVDDSIFFLGASSSGVSFHKHADGWNGVIYGQKRWFLYDIQQTPPGGVYPGFTQTIWYDKIYPTLDEAHKPMECVQEAGEILYLPEGTYHGTINLGDTVAIGIQKKHAKTKEERLFYEEVAVSNELGTLGKTDEKRKKLESRKVQIFNRLQQLLPDNAEVKMKLGQLYADLQRFRDGLDMTQKAIDLDQNFVIAHLNKGKIYVQMKRTKEAEKAYKTALALNDDLWDIHASLGDLYLTGGRPAEAVPHFRKGTELQPEMMPFWLYLQQAQQQSGDKHGAAITAQIMNKLRLKNMKTETLKPSKKPT